MVSINGKQIIHFQPTKVEFISIVKQTAIALVFLVMLLLTGGKSPALVAILSLLLAIAFITKNKKKKIANPKQQLAITKDFAGANLREVNLSNTNLRSVDLRIADLSNANLSNADLRHANLRIANLSNANLSNSDARGANLSVAYLKGVNLNDADLRGVNLNGANLNNANLCDANLNDADLGGANLNGANLCGASLRNTNLSRANVKNARFKDNLGLSEDIKRDLNQRGAIFENSSDKLVGILAGV